MSKPELLIVDEDEPIRTQPAPAAIKPLPETASRSIGGARRVKLRPQHGWQAIDLQELWQYRELLWILALRDVKVRYEQTVLGVAWAIIQPFCTMVVFTIIAELGNLSTDTHPPPSRLPGSVCCWGSTR